MEKIKVVCGVYPPVPPLQDLVSMNLPLFTEILRETKRTLINERTNKLVDT